MQHVDAPRLHPHGSDPVQPGRREHLLAVDAPCEARLFGAAAPYRSPGVEESVLGDQRLVLGQDGAEVPGLAATRAPEQSRRDGNLVGALGRSDLQEVEVHVDEADARRRSGGLLPRGWQSGAAGRIEQDVAAERVSPEAARKPDAPDRPYS